MSESSKTRAIIFALVRAHRWALLGYLVALVLAVVGARLGEAHSLWWYLLGTPLVLLAVREVPSSVAERKARRVERARVQAVARERGYGRHVRPDK